LQILMDCSVFIYVDNYIHSEHNQWIKLLNSGAHARAFVWITTAQLIEIFLYNIDSIDHAFVICYIALVSYVDKSILLSIIITQCHYYFFTSWAYKLLYYVPVLLTDVTTCCFESL